VTVRIVSDTACDLPDELTEELGVELVPLHVRFGATELVDRRELGTKEFWARCAEAEELPTTAAPSPGAFQDAFQRLADQGADGVVCITLSGKLSATYQSAAQAARDMASRLPVEVLDSMSATMGEGLVVLEAAEAARNGASLEDVMSRAQAACRRLSVFGTIDTLENLRKGGRIGGAAALLGTLLSIKPVLEVRDGAVEQESRQRTRARSLRYLADKARAAAPLDRLAAVGAEAPDLGEFVSLLSDIPSRSPLFVGDIGPVIGTHAGPGTIGVAWLAQTVG
jgi:fatty acid kinase fatty acid binding subunit